MLKINITVGLLISAFILNSHSSYCQTSKQKVFKDSALIKEWFIKNIEALNFDDSPNIRPFLGDSYSVLFLPQKEFIGKVNLGNYYNDERDGMFGKRRLNLWLLFNAKDATTGFIYPGLKGTVYTLLKSKEDFIIKRLIQWEALVIYGSYKKITLPYTDNGFDVFFENYKSNTVLSAMVTGLERESDTLNNTDVFHFLLPKALANVKKYSVYTAEPGGDISDDTTNGFFSLDELEASESLKISIESVPDNCTIYKVSQADYDLDTLFELIERNNYILIDDWQKQLDKKYLLSSSNTNTEIESKEITYIFFIRNKLQLSPPLRCKPKPNTKNKVSYKFTR